MKGSKVTVHMVSSLDGFVAKQDDSISWMQSKDTYEAGKQLTDDDISNYLSGIDCYVMGARTYEHALKLGWVYGNTPVTVLSSKIETSDHPTVQFFRGPLDVLIKNLTKNHQNIWVVGGPSIVREFLHENLVNEIVISLLPIILGVGRPFFEEIDREYNLHLTDVTAYRDGMVELCYTL